jgi:hypothetical protein
MEGDVENFKDVTYIAAVRAPEIPTHDKFDQHYQLGCYKTDIDACL